MTQTETKPTHHPAPWRRVKDVILGPTDETVALVSVILPESQVIPTANLIAASPALLSACESLVAVLEDIYDEKIPPDLALAKGAAHNAIYAARQNGGAL